MQTMIELRESDCHVSQTGCQSYFLTSVEMKTPQSIDEVLGCCLTTNLDIHGRFYCTVFGTSLKMTRILGG
jgi:hypothetical protein